MTLISASWRKSAAELIENGWVLKKEMHGVPSSASKWPLMFEKATRHDLILLSGRVPIEIIEHDTRPRFAKNKIVYDMAEQTPVIKVRDITTERDFFCRALSFQKKYDDLILLQNHIPSWSIGLRLEECKGAVEDSYFDEYGYSCLAFYSNSVEQDFCSFKGLGARDAIDPFEGFIGGRKLLVGMIRSPNGTIIELIQVKR